MLAVLDGLMIQHKLHPSNLQTLKEIWKRVCEQLDYNQRVFVRAWILKVKWSTNDEILNIIESPSKIQLLKQKIIQEATDYIFKSEKTDWVSLEKIWELWEKKAKLRFNIIQEMIEETTQEWSEWYDPEDDFNISSMWYNLEYPFSENEKQYFCMLKMQDLKKKKS